MKKYLTKIISEYFPGLRASLTQNQTVFTRVYNYPIRPIRCPLDKNFAEASAIQQTGPCVMSIVCPNFRLKTYPCHLWRTFFCNHPFFAESKTFIVKTEPGLGYPSLLRFCRPNPKIFSVKGFAILSFET